MCFITEYCKGGELRALLKEQGPLDESVVYHIASSVVEVLRH